MVAHQARYTPRARGARAWCEIFWIKAGCQKQARRFHTVQAEISACSVRGLGGPGPGQNLQHWCSLDIRKSRISLARSM